MLHSGDAEAEQLYGWHIATRTGGRESWKRSVGDYLESSKQLFRSMQREGFNPNQAIPIDPDGELLAGAHRVACALALDIDVTVQRHTRKVWAPPWGYDWFVNAGLDYDNMIRLERDWETISAIQESRDE